MLKDILIRLLESIADRELRRSEVEQVDNLLAKLEENTKESIDHEISNIDGVEFDEKEEGFQVQASSHSHD